MGKFTLRPEPSAVRKTCSRFRRSPVGKVELESVGFSFDAADGRSTDGGKSIGNGFASVVRSRQPVPGQSTTAVRASTEPKIADGHSFGGGDRIDRSLERCNPAITKPKRLKVIDERTFRIERSDGISGVAGRGECAAVDYEWLHLAS